jgi:hypothetical protein
MADSFSIVSESGNSLKDHRFLLKVAKNAKPAVRQIGNWLKAARKRRVDPPRLPLRHSYHAGVFWGAGKLCHIPREIKACEIFIAGTPSNCHRNQFGFGQTDYVHNHYYAYLMLMESSYDWALRLCHSVFNLGEPPVGSSIAGEWMERTGVSQELQHLASRAKAVRQIRHEIVIPTMTRPVNLLTEPFLKSCLNLAQAGVGSFKQKRALPDTLSPAEILRLVHYVSKNRVDLTKTIDALLNNLLPVYEKWTQVFSLVKY